MKYLGWLLLGGGILIQTVLPLRWAVPPTLVADESVAYYGIEVQFGDEAPLINLVVFDFGRQGYEEITVVMGAMRFGAGKAEQIALESAGLHKFGEGSRYQDFVQGDKIAAMGAAAVVAGSLLGVRWNKGMFSGIIAGIVLLAKKAWFLLILPFVWLGRVVNRMFGGGQAEETQGGYI